MIKPLDIKGRADAFVGDAERDGGSFYAPLCLTCKHKLDIHTCKAYPDGIPVAIIIGDVDHHHPYVGDHLVTYEAK